MITLASITRKEFDAYRALLPKEASASSGDTGRIKVRGVTVGYLYNEPSQTLCLEIVEKPVFISIAYAEKRLMEWVRQRIDVEKDILEQARKNVDVDPTQPEKTK